MGFFVGMGYMLLELTRLDAVDRGVYFFRREYLPTFLSSSLQCDGKGGGKLSGSRLQTRSIGPLHEEIQ